jgi:hypothetical protein
MSCSFFTRQSGRAAYLNNTLNLRWS